MIYYDTDMEINYLQTSIMLCIKEWANTQKTPVPRKYILTTMTQQGVKSFTALNAINSLLHKGYLRRAYNDKKNITKYVMIRNVTV